jgi:hypothetical protein
MRKLRTIEHISLEAVLAYVSHLRSHFKIGYARRAAQVLQDHRARPSCHSSLTPK